MKEEPQVPKKPYFPTKIGCRRVGSKIRGVGVGRVWVDRGWGAGFKVQGTGGLRCRVESVESRVKGI